MKTLYYKFLGFVSTYVGDWFFSVFAGVVATAFFVGRPRRVKEGTAVYRALFPGRSVWFYIVCVFKQYMSFTTVYQERFRYHATGNVFETSTGWEHIKEIARSKTGGILLMSHIGHWEVGAHLLKNAGEGANPLFFMGAKEKEQIEAAQKSDLAAAGFRVIAGGTEADPTFEMIEGARHLAAGGIISMAGDVVRHPSQRTVRVRFLENTARIPAAPFHLARITGRPILVFFSLRTGRGRFQFHCTPPLFVRAISRDDREAVVSRAAQQYADHLASILKKYPFQWYHFSRFLESADSAKHR